MLMLISFENRNINNQEGINMKTPLHIAVEYKNVATVTALLDLGVDLNSTDLRHNTVIHQGANGNVNILKVDIHKITFLFYFYGLHFTCLHSTHFLCGLSRKFGPGIKI